MEAVASVATHCKYVLEGLASKALYTWHRSTETLERWASKDSRNYMEAYMKHRLTRFILTAGLSALFGLVLSAQDQKAKANIPFAFQTSNRTLAAGEYVVQETSARGIFAFSDSAGHALFVTAHPNDTGAPANPRLLFRCYGRERMLSEIWMDDGSSYVVTESAAEKNLRRQLNISSLVSVALHR
jgi:hypothetical protein